MSAVFECTVTSNSQDFLDPNVKRQLFDYINKIDGLTYAEGFLTSTKTDESALADLNQAPLLIYAKSRDQIDKALLKFSEQTGINLHTVYNEISEDAWLRPWQESSNDNWFLETTKFIVTKKPIGSTKIQLIINAGNTFGQGDHATTEGCLKVLEEKLPKPNIRSVLDIGTGSGILAIAATKLGADVVYGTDLTAAILKTAKSNAELNKVDIHFNTDLKKIARDQNQFDLFIVNILMPEMLAALQDALALLDRPNFVLTSGYIGKEAPALQEKMLELKYKLQDTVIVRGWYSQLFQTTKL